MTEEKRQHLFGDSRTILRRTYEGRVHEYEPVEPMPPNALTNSDGTPYQAGYDEAMKEAKLRELVFHAIGEASMCWEKIPQGKFDDARAKAIGEDLINKIKSLT